MLVASYGDETTVLARVLPSVCNVGILERLASVDVLPLFNTAFPLVNSCALLKNMEAMKLVNIFLLWSELEDSERLHRRRVERRRRRLYCRILCPQNVEVCEL